MMGILCYDGQLYKIRLKMADNSSVVENIKNNVKAIQEDFDDYLGAVAKAFPNFARQLKAIMNELENIDIDKIESIEQKILDNTLGELLKIKNNFCEHQYEIEYMGDLGKRIGELEQSIASIKKTLDVNKTLSRAKEALDNMQKATTIKFSSKLYVEYEALENKYFWTGVVWQILAVVSFICIFCVLFHEVKLPKAVIDINGSIGNSFVFSVYALNPVFAKIGLIIFFGAMAGVCLRIYSEYKRLSQEYRQKSLLAKNLLTGHEVLKPYIGDKIDTAFILPTIEKMLEDPLTKVYSNKESKEDALGLVEKIMELGKKGKELGDEKAKSD